MKPTREQVEAWAKEVFGPYAYPLEGAIEMSGLAYAAGRKAGMKEAETLARSMFNRAAADAASLLALADQMERAEPACWAILTPNGSRLVSEAEAKGKMKPYPLYTHPAPEAQTPKGATEMTDRELLELAAKAAGIALVFNDKEIPGYYSDWRGLPQWEEWNPLTDDGDALRLAVALGMTVQFTNWCCSVTKGSSINATELAESWESKAATARRAIVRAAAEIGRSMK